MKNKTINALIEMGMPANIRGFHYIVDAMIMFEEKDECTERTTELYQKIAEMHNTTAQRVERAIRHAFQIVLKDGYLESVEKYLTLQRATNGNLLHTLYLRLSMED